MALVVRTISIRASVNFEAMNNDLTKARKIYVDSNIVIYFIEGEPDMQDRVIAVFEYAERHGIPLMTSDLTVGECLYGAYKNEWSDSAKEFENLFDTRIFHLIPLEPDIISSAARLGGTTGLKLIDAIHVASAIDTDCDTFVTNDRGIKSLPNLTVVQLMDI